MPTLPGLWMKPGMMPIFAPAGVMIPGQFGPMSLHGSVEIADLTRTMSSTGTPSVMHTMSSSPASAPSRMASAAKGAGT